MQNNSYIFDGTFEGFLTVFYQICQDGQPPAGIMDESYIQKDLFSVNLNIATDNEKAAQVWEECRKRLSRNSLHSILFCFLSSRNDFYLALYNYLALGWKYGKKLSPYQAHPYVRLVHKVAQEVGFEIHRFKGLLRFQEMKTGHLYAPYSPDHNITYALSKHFQFRLRIEKWVIHDVGRNVAVFWDSEKLRDIDLDPQFAKASKTKDLQQWNASDESIYQDLWQTFFDTVAISSRENPKLQRQFLPQRYWNYLTEKKNRSVD